MTVCRSFIISILLILTPSLVSAGFYSCKGDIFGIVETYKVKEGESLIETARRFGLGYNEITDANPGLDPFVPGTNVPVKIPTSWILPDGSKHNCLVINLSERRLYYLFQYKGSQLVATFPIGVGSKDSGTSIGDFRVIEKVKNPTWFVPESIRKGNPKLPAQMPPGPDNPLGSHALKLSSENILVHGTNRPWGIGRRVSHGCIRLYPEDIPQLFRLVPVSAKVAIVRQPVKIGVKNNKVYIEVHKDDSGDIDVPSEAMRLLKKKRALQRVSAKKLLQTLKEKTGIPTWITN